MDAVWRQQKLIRTAEMAIKVDSVDRAMKEVEAIAGRHAGLVADTMAEQYGDGNRRAVITVRVPSADFAATMGELRQLGEMEREKISTEDVTKAYADLETRLSVKKKTQERLREILSSRAGNLAEVLEAERELSRVTSEMELLQGEQRYYDNRIAISTIGIAVHERGSVLGRNAFAPIKRALGESVSVLANAISSIIYVFVFLLPWSLVGLAVWWVVKRGNRGRRPGSTA